MSVAWQVAASAGVVLLIIAMLNQLIDASEFPELLLVCIWAVLIICVITIGAAAMVGIWS